MDGAASAGDNVPCSACALQVQLVNSSGTPTQQSNIPHFSEDKISNVSIPNTMGFFSIRLIHELEMADLAILAVYLVYSNIVFQTFSYPNDPARTSARHCARRPGTFGPSRSSR